MLTASKMEIDYIFPRRIFSSKEAARAKILTEWKTAFTMAEIQYLFKKKSSYETLFFVIGWFCTLHSICLNIGL